MRKRMTVHYIPGHISQQNQSDKQIRGLDKFLNPLNNDLFGAEGRICQIVNDNNKLLNLM